MKIICAPDSFKQSISGVDAARAMAVGAKRAASEIVCDRCPVGDGGEGTLDALAASLGGDRIGLQARDLFGAAIKDNVDCWKLDSEIYIESASVIGMQLYDDDRRDILRASSRGVGELIAAAVQHDIERLLVGVGGSATNDGGCGMAQALGVRFIDASGKVIEQSIGGGMLRNIAAIDLQQRTRELERVEVLAACDVRNPLTGPDGASRIYAPQKGASESDVEELETGLLHLAEIIRRNAGVDVASIPGAGAAGGLAAGLVAFAGATIVPGVDFVLERVRFSERVQDADLCLTGEGRLDAQSLSGKACLGVARAAKAHGVPTIALVGSAGPGAEKSLAAGLDEYRVIAPDLSPRESMARAASLLEDATAACVRDWLARVTSRERG